MDTTRRSVLVSGGVIGAGLIASHIRGVEALAAGALPTRRSLQGLAWNDPIVACYRDAVGILKQKPSSDPLNWVNLANFHGNVNTGFKYCPHGDWYFLPWHRAYTAMYERIVRTVAHDNSFAMPYWDWTANPLMPAVFLDKKTPDGKTNWLNVDEDGMSRTWPPNKPMPANIVGPAVLDKILTASPYELFGTSRNRNQTNHDPSWVPAGGGVQGVLESTPHNNVHNNIGGWMPTAASPRDPIFFMHHGNIDRIWTLWNRTFKDSGDPLWTGMPFQNNYLNPNGTFWSPKVSDLLVPETLGYTYGFPSTKVLNSSVVLSLQSKLQTIFAIPTPDPSPVAGITRTIVENSATATAQKPISLSLSLTPETIGRILERKPLGSGHDSFSFNEVIEQEASGTRALAILRDVAITDPSTTEFRVFLDAEGLSSATPTTDPHYVGTFAVLDHSVGHSGHEKALPSFVVDLTDAIQNVYGSGLEHPQSVELQLLPVSNTEAVSHVGTATPTRVEVLVVSS
jgi:tyrosinase